MTTHHGRRFHVLALLVAAAALDLGASPAHALWDFGWGGFMGFNYVPSPTDYLAQNSAIRAQLATRGPVANNVYANNPNSFHNRVRDNGFTPHYSTATRTAPGLGLSTRRGPSRSSQASSSTPPPASTPAPAATLPAVARPVVQIGSFFDAARRLVWPSDAPAGDLLPKRNVSDQACLAVADLVQQHGAAPITTATNARQKLLAYGQPALQFLRTTSTQRVAESFHLFLLSLYESLEQAANPPAR